jgi:hypothetical protein
MASLLHPNMDAMRTRSGLDSILSAPAVVAEAVAKERPRPRDRRAASAIGIAGRAGGIGCLGIGLLRATLRIGAWLRAIRGVGPG